MKSTIVFRKASFKQKISKNSVNSFLKYKYGVCTQKNGFLSNKQLECLRVTVSRLCKKNISYWNNKKYLQSSNYLNVPIENNDFKSIRFNRLKRIFLLKQRDNKLILNRYHKKKGKKKKIKKRNLSLKKQAKQKDILYRTIRKKVEYILFNRMNTKFVKRSNKSRMGKGKSKVDFLVRKVNSKDFLFLFKDLDNIRKNKIIEQLNHKTNLNLYLHNLHSNGF